MSASARVWVYMAIASLCGNMGILLGQQGNWFGCGWLIVLSGGFFAACLVQLIENIADKRKDARGEVKS
jgi:hypothetical protein